MIVARRVYLYVIAFAAIWVLINGISGLLTVALEAIVEALLGPFLSVGADNLTDRVSFYGALTGIGLVVWVIHWGLAVRAVSRDPLSERRSAIRKLYLYGVLLVGGLIVLVQLSKLFGDLFGLAFGIVGRIDLVNGDVVPPFSMIATTGAFVLYHLRRVEHDRAVIPEAGAGAMLRRWCIYLLSLVGLLVLLFSVAGLVGSLIGLALPSEAEITDTGRWLAYDFAGRLGSALAGLAAWWFSWTRSSRLHASLPGPDPERDSVLRKVYLYAVLFISVSWTVWNLARVLYVVLRSILIPSQAGSLWSAVQDDLGETAALLLVFGISWAYHASVLKREAAATPERQRQASIRWIYGYIVALVGAATFATGLEGTLSTALELLVDPSGTYRSEHWWEERLALFTTMIVVGIPVWLFPWLRLQREADAGVARRSLARRIYLFLVLGITVLTLLGSGAYTLYQILRVVLGDRWTGSDTDTLIEAGSAAAVAALFLVYHLRVFQRDAALARQDEATSPPGAVPATPTPLLADTVTLVVVRAASAEDAAAIQAHVAGALPAGATVETVRVSQEEAERLLGDR